MTDAGCPICDSLLTATLQARPSLRISPCRKRRHKKRPKASKSDKNQAREKEHKLLGPDIFRWGRGLPREGVGAKKFGMSFESQGNQTSGRGFSLDFCRDIPKGPEKFERKKFVFKSWPLKIVTKR